MIEEYHTGDAVLTTCGEYGTFCCGQDSDSRACCDAGNATLVVGGGEAMCNETILLPPTTVTVSASQPNATGESSNVKALRAEAKKKDNITIGVAVALGVALLGAVAYIMFLRSKLAKSEMAVVAAKNEASNSAPDSRGRLIMPNAVREILAARPQG